MIKQCTCKHEGQDKIHGKGNRVYNDTAVTMVRDGKDRAVARCTVCGKEH